VESAHFLHCIGTHLTSGHHLLSRQHLISVFSSLYFQLPVIRINQRNLSHISPFDTLLLKLLNCLHCTQLSTLYSNSLEGLCDLVLVYFCSLTDLLIHRWISYLTHPSTHPTFLSSTHPPTHQPIHPSIHPLYLSIHIHPSIYPSLHLSIMLPPPNFSSNLQSTSQSCSSGHDCQAALWHHSYDLPLSFQFCFIPQIWPPSLVPGSSLGPCQ
jgi:hypothetical protein